ncbi:MAG: hypothetical protein ABIU05_13285 [Nitrospirales bacterium]
MQNQKGPMVSRSISKFAGVISSGWWVLVSTLVLPAVLGITEAEAGTLREFSGDAMQRHDSRMMASPLERYPGLFGISPWPYIAYPPSPSMTIVNVQIPPPELNQSPPPPPTPPARAKFWTARCGVFAEFEVSSTMNLMEEERKACSP